MKTICPHCNQEYLETPDEYLGMTLQCSVCQKEFVCEKAKFCPECGAIHHAKAKQCTQCGKILLAVPQLKPEPPPVQNYNSEDYTHHSSRKTFRISSADNLSFWDKAGINWCIIVGVTAPLLFCIVPLVRGSIILAVCLLPASIICFHGACLLNSAKNPKKKIYWTPYRKFVLTASCLCFILLGIAICIVVVIEGNPKGLFVTFPITVCGIFGSILGWKLFNTRAEEDIDYEESEEDISKARVDRCLSVADACGLGALIPIIGLNFLLVSLIFLTIYKVKGGTNCWKTVILCILGIGVQAVTIYYIRKTGF